MARTKIGLLLLAITLLVSNVWWAFQSFDSRVTQSYMAVSLEDNRIALDQAIAVAKEASRADATRDSIAMAATLSGAHAEPFEKDGFIWIGRIGLKFQDDGTLQDVVRAWSPP